MSRKQLWLSGGLAGMFLVWGVIAGTRGEWLGWALVVSAVLMIASLLLEIRSERRRHQQGIFRRGEPPDSRRTKGH
jgi:hypothetical protein